jgi:threonine dehydrogenase-like Zn-dependent dehydrogenase
MDREPLRAATQTLLEKGGFGDAFDLTPICRGADNRAFGIGTERGPFCLKTYFHHPDHERDRLVTVDDTGRVGVVQSAYALTQRNGRTILVRLPPKSERVATDSLPLHFGEAVTSSHGGVTCPDEDIPRRVDLGRTGKLNLEPLVTDVCALDGGNKAIETFRQEDPAGRQLVDMSAETGS